MSAILGGEHGQGLELARPGAERPPLVCFKLNRLAVRQAFEPRELLPLGGAKRERHLGDRDRWQVPRVIQEGYDEPTRLVLLSVGRQDNVQEGYEFTIYRGTRFIARVKVEKVLPDLCGARVIFEVAKIQRGDLAATRLH